MWSGLDITMLTAALGSQTSMEAIEVGQYYEPLDRRSEPCLGMAQFTRDTGCCEYIEEMSHEDMAEMVGESIDVTTHVFAVVLNALAGSQCEITDLRALPRTAYKDNRDTDDSEPVVSGLLLTYASLEQHACANVDTTLFDGLRAPLHGLRSLELAFRGTALIEEADDVLMLRQVWFPDLIALCASLEFSTLSFDNCKSASSPGRPEYCSIAFAAFCSVYSTQDNRFRRLRSFSLRNAIVTGSEFCSFLLNHGQTLQKVGLMSVALKDGDNSSWPAMWERLRSRHISLDSLKMSFLQERRKMLCFDEEGVWECKICHGDYYSESVYKFKGCRHASYHSTTGHYPASTVLVPLQEEKKWRHWRRKATL